MLCYEERVKIKKNVFYHKIKSNLSFFIFKIFNFSKRVQVGEKIARAAIKLAMVEEPTKARNIKIVETIGTSVQLRIQN